VRAEVVGGNPSPEQVAAIVAALAVVEGERAAAAAAAVVPREEPMSMWVVASRRSAQRAGMQRGPWRLSGRIGKRARV
jgi:acyl-CoA carboxylase epsilon subunit-like protein